MAESHFTPSAPPLPHSPAPAPPPLPRQLRGQSWLRVTSRWSSTTSPMIGGARNCMIGLTLGHKSGGAWRPSQAAIRGGKAPCSVS